MNWKWLAALGATSLGASQADLHRMAARFAPTEIGADLSRLPESERSALAKLIQAAKLIDALFLRQVWSGNESVLLDLSKDTSALGRARLQNFLINKGPWSTLDGNAPFIPGVPPKPPPANFYPPGANKQAQPELADIASLLKETAALTTDPTLRAFLIKRAAAFSSNDYYDSDLAWMELTSAVEPTVGPYEVYQDEWFNAKAAFEAFIALRDESETAKLSKFGSELQEIEDHLPIEAQLRNPKLGAMAPIRVVNLIFSAGDGNHGVQTAAYNLPNDERITKEKGAKRVMLKNVQEAKFKVVLVPTAQVALAPAEQNRVTFEAFFTHILMHELMHGLGPHVITVGSRASTVRQELKDSYSAIEEAKADISGLFALQYLIDKGVLAKSMESTIYTTFLASCFRSLRFGITEAHAKGIALQLNYLLDAGAFGTSPDGTFFVNASKIKAGVAALTRELMTLQAQGNRSRAMQMLSSLSVVRAPVQKVLERLSHVPVDIEPKFKTAEALLEGRSGPSQAR